MKRFRAIRDCTFPYIPKFCDKGDIVEAVYHATSSKYEIRFDDGERAFVSKYDFESYFVQLD